VPPAVCAFAFSPGSADIVGVAGSGSRVTAPRCPGEAALLGGADGGALTGPGCGVEGAATATDGSSTPTAAAPTQVASHLRPQPRACFIGELPRVSRASCQRDAWHIDWHTCRTCGSVDADIAPTRKRTRDNVVKGWRPHTSPIGWDEGAGAVGSAAWCRRNRRGYRDMTA
jgi:hypothetical protein